MLKVKDVCKEYRTGSFIQTALNHVDLNLRDNEFVAILGPSGSGKTTLLNVIGGLDRYDSGDLIINGISTRKYRDRDWDAYRNHTIGFVFQSYNLIPHQTILANVELALTISGLTKKERKGKARKALERVGLGEQGHKKPGQLSGGQMQRVAIARALVNDPDIVLADEPTGALDSDTSVQVMELLKEVARDRLVVMVTHNPELARAYATRIVTLKDGRILGDTDPCPDDVSEEPPLCRSLGKAGMTPLTALQLSFNNLLTKKARTLLVAFAGSIGIIGIALIMSLSNGANAYIQSIEEKTLSEYPLEIGRSTLDMTSMLQVSSDVMKEEDDGRIHEQQVIAGMFGTVRENDLRSLKAYLESDETDIYDNVNAIEYGYNVEPCIYKIGADGSARQVSPDTVFSAMGFSGMTSLLSGYSMNTFTMLPRNSSLYLDQYEVVAGHWPEDSGDLLLVLSSTGGLSDLSLYNLGLKDPAVLDAMMKAYEEGKMESAPDLGNPGSWSYEEVLGARFYLLSPVHLYTHDEDTGLWVNSGTSVKKLTELVKTGKELCICGIVKPKAGVSNPLLAQGFCYTPELVDEVILEAADSELVKCQLREPSVNVFTGKSFDEETADFDLSSLFKVDENALSDLFSFDPEDMVPTEEDFSGMEITLPEGFEGGDLSSLLDRDTFSALLSGITPDTLKSIFQNVTVTVTEENLSDLTSRLYEGFTLYCEGDPTLDLNKLGEGLEQYFETEEAADLLRSEMDRLLQEVEDPEMLSGEIREAAVELLKAYGSYALEHSLSGQTQEELVQAFLESEEGQNALRGLFGSVRDLLKEALSSEEGVRSLLSAILQGYGAYAAENALPVPEEIKKAFSRYLETDGARAILQESVTKMVDVDQLSANLNSLMAGIGARAADVLSEKIQTAMASVMTELSSSVTASVSSMMTDYMSTLSDRFTFSADALSEMIGASMNTENLQEMMASLFTDSQPSAAKNLKSLGYADPENPETITFYPINFECKTRVVEILTEYNEKMTEEGEEDKVITFTDLVGSLMSSVTNIVDIIGYVLIAFVAISLVVSSIMIGVITYISVLERRKEIGILRAMGASKHNITEVFNAETVITGLLAGVLGVGISLLILIPANAILQHLTGEPDLRAFLPLESGLLLVLLSIILTTLGGLIPSKGAARQDPVAALRSE